MASTVSKDGSLVPSVTSTGKGAVKDLVTGVTGTLDQATNGATAPVTKPLDDTVKKLGDTIGELTESLTGGASLPTATASPSPLLPGTEKAIGDATETVKDGLGKTLKDATGGDLPDLPDPLHP